MNIIEEVTVKRFNENLVEGTPIRVTYTNVQRSGVVIDYGIILGNTLTNLRYSSFNETMGKVRNYDLNPNKMQGIKIDIGIWSNE